MNFQASNAMATQIRIPLENCNRIKNKKSNVIKLLKILPEQSINHKPKQHNKHYEQNHNYGKGFHCFYNGCCDILHFPSAKCNLKNYLISWKKFTWMWASKTVEHATLEYLADQCRLESFQIALQKYCKSTHMHSDLANRDAAKRNCKIDLAWMGFQNDVFS